MGTQDNLKLDKLVTIGGSDDLSIKNRSLSHDDDDDGSSVSSELEQLNVKIKGIENNQKQQQESINLIL